MAARAPGRRRRDGKRRACRRAPGAAEAALPAGRGRRARSTGRRAGRRPRPAPGCAWRIASSESQTKRGTSIPEVEDQSSQSVATTSAPAKAARGGPDRASGRGGRWRRPRRRGRPRRGAWRRAAGRSARGRRPPAAPSRAALSSRRRGVRARRPALAGGQRAREVEMDPGVVEREAGEVSEDPGLRAEQRETSRAARRAGELPASACRARDPRRSSRRSPREHSPSLALAGSRASSQRATPVAGC